MLARVIGFLGNLEKDIEALPENVPAWKGAARPPDDPFLGDERAPGPLRAVAVDLSRWGHNPKKKACHKPRSHHRAQTPFFSLPF